MKPTKIGFKHYDTVELASTRALLALPPFGGGGNSLYLCICLHSPSFSRKVHTTKCVFI
jgi:hypothetical protein